MFGGDLIKRGHNKHLLVECCLGIVARLPPLGMNTPSPTIDSQEQALTRRPTRLGETLLVCLLALVPILVKLACYPTYPGSDDAFIHLTIVRNVTHGLGWGINPGEPVNLSSSPLYTILLSLLSLGGFNALTAGMWLSALAGFGALVAMHRLLTTLGLRQSTRVAGVAFAAFNFYLWRWNGVVMETTLSLCLLTCAYWSYHVADRPGRATAGRYLLTGVLAGLTMLTRFELALAMVCFGLRELALSPAAPARWLRSCTLLGIGFLGMVAPWFLFCRWYFHLMLPTTFYAKTSHGLIWWNPIVTADLLKVIGSGYVVPLLGLGVLLALAVVRKPEMPGTARSVVARLDVYLLPALLALFYYVKTPYLESSARYYLPGLQLLAAAMACALDTLADGLPAGWVRPAVTVLVVVDAMLSLGFNQWRVAPILSRFKDNYWRVAQESAGVLRSHAADGRKVKVLVEVDIGMLAFYAGDACYFFDGGALATPSLKGLTIAQQVERTRPDLVIEPLGSAVGDLSARVPALIPSWHQDFRSHSVTSPNGIYTATSTRSKCEPPRPSGARILLDVRKGRW